MRPKPVRTSPPKRTPSPRPGTRKGETDFSWIQALASPYLQGYRASLVSTVSLRGYRFTGPPSGVKKFKVGFFVGYAFEPGNLGFLSLAPPECIVFAFVGPVGSALQKEIVERDGSLLRKTAEYIGWLTHRPPRFAFFDDREIALVRHFSMTAWPKPKHQHYSRNFFIETLAWLVRSGLVAKLCGDAPRSAGGSR